MFDDKELEAKIIAYLEKKRYATILMIARACRCHYNDVPIAFAQMEASGNGNFYAIAQVWNKKLNINLSYYTLTHEGALALGAKITRTHKALQKRWLYCAVIKAASKISCTTTYVEYLKNMGESERHPMYFLLANEDVLGVYKSILRALPKP